MGNSWSNGKTAQPSKGPYWADWERTVASEPGKGPGPGGFQELDLDVKVTTLLTRERHHVADARRNCLRRGCLISGDGVASRAGGGHNTS